MAIDAVLAEAQNPLLPASYDIIWSLVCFVAIAFLFWKYVMPRFGALLDERAAKIEGGIAKAEAAQAEAAELLEQYKAQLAEARSEAARIRDDARAEGEQIVEEMRQRAQEESARILAQGQLQLDAQRAQIVTELRGDLGRIAVDLAGRVVGESLEDEARQRGTVDRFLDELDSVSAPAKS
ncbi:F-type H+-transporting ATPase subunit b [Actinoalloteichus hoggarensis]|uniref:ATP synthase subunit b n=1 Tax=Actinoalloteichus hoggarensis TaxID=1470176 RepID=A0A221W0C3_9PSEU|nr:F0F1 ATP synthase subunit B [Actinoalloteichus hoggarensis]ASO19001.1 ATP synthase subunit b [Actinoalloteichus hoggarensis]MBB5920237.1 F-type H+-transporting ATPase subunit b [Actinoalloteichus hoggarensis]